MIGCKSQPDFRNINKEMSDASLAKTRYTFLLCSFIFMLLNQNVFLLCKVNHVKTLEAWLGAWEMGGMQRGGIPEQLRTWVLKPVPEFTMMASLLASSVTLGTS